MGIWRKGLSRGRGRECFLPGESGVVSIKYDGFKPWHTGLSVTPPTILPTIPPSPQHNPIRVKARDSFEGSVILWTAPRATPTAPGMRVSSFAYVQTNLYLPLNNPMANRMQMAVPRFCDVPNATRVIAFPSRLAKRTALRPCFSATETHSNEVKN